MHLAPACTLSLARRHEAAGEPSYGGTFSFKFCFFKNFCPAAVKG